MMDKPDKLVKAKKVFDIDVDMEIPAFSQADDYTPDVDPDYFFDTATTMAILAGFSHNRRVMIQGFHGTGKSSHIEQVAARLNWPCMRINLDSQISRLDLVGKDVITLNNGHQVTEFKEGVLPWALQRPVALIFDEYDAARPDVMFVIQRVLEVDGKLTLLDENRVIYPHSYFRLFATANTVGLGDVTGLYHGTQHINQAQMDRWGIVASLNYLPEDHEFKIVNGKTKGKVPEAVVKTMIKVANRIRQTFMNGELSTVMSPRSVIAWAENSMIFKDTEMAFAFSFLNKCDPAEKSVIAAMYKDITKRKIPDQYLLEKK